MTQNKKWKKIVSGMLAGLMMLSTIGSGMTVFATEEQALQILDVTQRTDLEADEIVSASDIFLAAGDDFSVEKDFDGLEYQQDKVKISYEHSKDETGHAFDNQRAGTYDVYYKVQPVSGKTGYLIVRKIIVKENTNVQSNDNGSTGDEQASDSEDSDSEDTDSDDEAQDEMLVQSALDLVDVNVYLNFYDQSKGDQDAVISMTGTTVKGVIVEDMILASVNPVPGYFEFDQNDWPRVYINYSGLNNEKDITDDCEYDAQTGIIMIPAEYKDEVLTVKSVIGDESYAYVNMIAEELKFPAVDSKESYSKYVLNKADEKDSIEETTDAIEEIFGGAATYDLTGAYSPQNGYEAYIIPDGWSDKGSASWTVPMNKTFKVAYDPSQYYEGQVIYLDGAFVNIMGTSNSSMWEKTGLSEYKGYDGGFGFAVCMWKQGTPFHLLGTPGTSSETHTYTWEWSGDSSNRKYYTWGYNQLNWLFGTCVMRIANAGSGNIVGHDARVYVTNKAADGTLTCYLWVGTSTDSSTSTSSMQNVGLYFRVKPDGGKLSLKKASSNSSVSANTAYYSLAGAKYTVYTDTACTKSTGLTLTTDANGDSNVLTINAAGTYYVKETTAPKGFRLDTAVHPVTVTAGNTAVVNVKDEPKSGYVKVQKVSGNTALVKNNSCYSLKGATYGIYWDEACTNKLATLTTDEDGNTNTQSVSLGKYYVKEISASKGYELDPKVYPVDVTADGNTYSITSTEKPGVDTMLVQVFKIDQETGDHQAQGTAALSGAEFTVKHYGGTYTKEEILEGKPQKDGVAVRTWVMTTKESDGACKLELMKDYLVSGDDFYYENDQPALPLGTMTIEESKAPDGYLKDGANVQYKDENGKYQTLNDSIIVSHISKEQDTAVKMQFGHEYKYADLVKRGDFEFVKTDESGNAMADIPFVITAQSTGESHTVRTDANGYFDTASDYVKHSENTNSGKAESGVWFGLDKDGKNTKVDDNRGALPFDTYTVVEKRCEANKGMTLRKFTVVISRDKVKIDRGTVVNEVYSFHTNAVDAASGTHVAAVRKDAKIVDTVTYEKLAKGEQYTLKGILMDRDTGKAVLDASGKTVEATQTFKAVYPKGSVDVTFQFDASNMGGKRTVVYEYLYGPDGEFLGEHAKLDAADQQVDFPAIKTTAVDKETEKQISNADAKITIKDTVKYSGLKDGKYYTVTGKLINKETGDPMLDDQGNTITAKAGFLAASGGKGSVDVIFTFKGVSLAGTKVVAFEELYEKDIKIAVHTDINDDEQTVSIPKIATTALGKDSKDHIVLAGEDAVIVDTITYKGLIPGQKYVANGVLVDQNTGKEITGGSATETFVANAENGTTSVTFKVNTTKLAGKTVVVYESLYIDKADDSKLIATHKVITDAKQTIHIPEIGTTALDAKTQTHTAAAVGNITIVDTVTYKNLLPGKAYTVKGVLMDKKTNKELLVKGAKVTAEAKFTAEKADGSVKLSFTFPVAGLEGKKVVAFEEVLYDNAKVGVHADIEDQDQTIDIPKIETTALDASTKEHISNASDPIKIVDTVSYQGLTGGKEYTMHGILMDKETSEPILDDKGEEIKASTTFTAVAGGTGTIDVVFEFEGVSLAGKQVVAFESAEYKEIEIAVHADIDDEDQLITIPDIHTTAIGEDTQDHIVMAGEETTVIDTIEYKGLIAGKEYVATGYLMDKATGEAINDDNGKKVVGTTTFTAEEPDGTVDVVFKFAGKSAEGKTLVAFEYVTIDDVEVARHEDIEDVDQTVLIPKIRTNATDKETNTNMALADTEVEIVDHVTYENLVPGKEYTVKGILMIQDTEEALLIDGKEVTAVQSFVPEEANGIVDLTFTFDGSALKGQAVVAFEDIYYGEIKVGTHSDITDESQTVYFPEIGTKATDKADGDQKITAAKKVTIVDTVSYKNLTVSSTYKITGILMDKKSGKALLVNGKEVVAETSFTAKESSGEEQVSFTFDAENLAGTSVVVFEKVYYVNADGKDTEIANHEDLNDENQTVSIVPVPKTVKGSVKTGDNNQIFWLTMLMAGAALSSFLLLAQRKKRKQ